MNALGIKHPARLDGRFCSGLLLCLIALFAQIVVPVAHRYFLDVREMAEKAAEMAPDSRRTGNGLSGAWEEGHGEVSKHSSHDPESCAICQILLHASSFIGACRQGPVHMLPIIDRLDLDRSDSDLARFKPTTGCPRAPPHFT